MKTFKKLPGFGAAFLLVASMGTVYAEEGDVTQTSTQERSRLMFNLQTPTADFGQSQNREQHTVMNANQNQHQYKYQYQNKYQNKYQYGEAATKSGNAANNIWRGSNTSGSMDRMSATNRNMQGSTAAGSMNRQSTASRSMGGGRR